MSPTLVTRNRLPASVSRSGFTLIQLGPLLLGAILIAIVVVLLYPPWREAVAYWWREQFASTEIEPEENVAAASIRAALDTVQLTPPPAAANAAVTPPRAFLLTARYVDKDGNVLAGPASMQWGFAPTVDGSATPSGEITVRSFPNNGSSLGTVTASGSGMSDAVVIKRWANPGSAAAASDVVSVQGPQPTDVGPPSVVLVEEASQTTCAWGSPRTFLGAAAVGQQAMNPCSLSLLSANNAMVFKDNRGGTAWPANTWAANGASVAVAPAVRLKLDITVFIAPPDNAVGPTADPVLVAKNDVDMAKRLYQSNRTGIELNVKGYHSLPPASDLLVRLGADPYDCVLPVKLPANPANPTEFSYDSAAVSVYYVSTIAFPTDPAYPRVRGIQCHFWYSGNPAVGNAAAGRPPGNGPVVYISYGHHSPVTLAHELGHALGLKDEEGRLGPVDIMHNLLPDGDLGANARSDLTVGQVFRMNIWNDSYLNTRVPQPPQRACDALYPCPPAELDAH